MQPGKHREHAERERPHAGNNSLENHGTRSKINCVSCQEKPASSFSNKLRIALLKQTDDNDNRTVMSKIHLVILSLLRLVESSTTTGTPDLLLVVLLLLQHLSSLTVVLLDSELVVTMDI